MFTGSSAMSRAMRLYRTIRPLKARQIANRFARYLNQEPRQVRPTPEVRTPGRTWLNAPGRPASMRGENCFCFIGLEACVEAASDWNCPAMPRLWLYNLHYFDDLRAENSFERTDALRCLIERWIRENPPAIGAGWEPYPMSLRIVNWISWALAGNQIPSVALSSLADQIATLECSLEYHLLGNHLLANAKALIFAGCLFEGEWAERWRRLGIRIFAEQIEEQILDDGAHFELSPMYHSIILEDLVDLVQLSELYPQVLGDAQKAGDWRGVASRMLGWLIAMCHPDGEIAFFNDAAMGIAPTADRLTAYAEANGIRAKSVGGGLVELASSGYFRLSSGLWTILFDAAEIGPAYLPGHGHADVLAFEASLDGQRLLTNTGTSTYAPGSQRELERSTAAHATVEIDAENSSEVWASFRVGRRAHPSNIITSNTDGSIAVAASHDGYRHLSGSPMHRRKLSLSGTNLIIFDEIDGAGIHDVVGRFPLHPSVKAAAHEPGWSVQMENGRQVLVSTTGNASLSIERGIYCAAFGKCVEREVLTWRYRGPLPFSFQTIFSV